MHDGKVARVLVCGPLSLRRASLQYGSRELSDQGDNDSRRVLERFDDDCSGIHDGDSAPGRETRSSLV